MKESRWSMIESERIYFEFGQPLSKTFLNILKIIVTGKRP